MKEYSDAIVLLDNGLAQYDQTLLRGRARLIAQKSEAYYGLGMIDESAITGKEALTIAQLIGSHKTIARVSHVYTQLAQSPYRKEDSVVQLQTLLAVE